MIQNSKRNLVWQLTEWETPATHYQERQVGNYRLKKSEYKEGYYPHYCMDGYIYTQVLQPIPIMLLQEWRKGEWVDWMADDPMDYVAVQKYALAAGGKVLVAGLGLGLIIHELAKNKDVGEITLVERSPAVKALVHDYLPKGNLTFRLDDFWNFIARDKGLWDWIIVDIWATKGKEQHDRVFREEVLPASERLRKKYPSAKLVIHGFTEVTDVELVQPFFESKKKLASV